MQSESTHKPASGTIASGTTQPTSRFAAVARTFSALKHRNYRYYFIGQGISLIGTWMQMVAQGWLVYELTKSPQILGVTVFARGVPVLLFSLGAGVLVDRFPRRLVMLTTQTVFMVLALILSLLVFMRWVQPWHIVTLSFLGGFAAAFDGTARQTFVKDMVGKADMANAIALNSSLFQFSRIIGPALAGITLAWVGPEWCFLLNGLSYLAVIGGLLLMDMPEPQAPPRTSSMSAEMKEGLTYIWQHKSVLTLILVMAVSSIFGAYDTMLPAYARDILNINAQGLGWLSTAVGIGAFAGAIMMASLSHTKRKGLWLSLGNIVFPICLLLVAASNVFPWSLLMLTGLGWAFMVQGAAANTLVQASVPDHLRGRVMSVYMLAFFGLSPLGGLLAGTLAEYWGIQIGMSFGAIIALVFGVVVFFFVPRVRQME
jgi:MFS family permease